MIPASFDPQAALKNEKRLRLRQRTRNLLPAAPFVLPGLILACVFVVYPMLFNIRISFSDYQIVQRTMTWVGLDNYVALFTERGDRLLLAIRNNFLYAFFTTPFIMLFGLIFAVMVNSLKRSQLFFRTCFYLPVITSWVIVGNVFAYMFNAGGAGLVNYLLKDVLGLLPAYVPWLNRTWTANLVIWLLGIWKNIGWAMVIYLAGLQGISNDLYEASMLDGASRVQQVFHVTLPSIAPTIVLVSTLNLGNVLNAGFDQIFNMYNELIYESVDIIDTFVYRIGLVELNFSLSTAVGLFKSVVSFILITLSYWLAKKWTGYRIF